ncbi:hypothetical protein AgCh_035872 [Apium graveolens]
MLTVRPASDHFFQKLILISRTLIAAARILILIHEELACTPDVPNHGHICDKIAEETAMFLVHLKGNNTDSQGFEKYYVARFLDFKLVDGKSMTEQVHEFEMLVHDLGESGMVLLEKFQVMSVIEKLPKSWEEFALSLKRQKGEITWTNLMLDISVNVVTVGQKRKVVTKKANTKPDKNKAKKPKANKPCWSCGRVGHWSKDCPSKKAGVVAQANTVLGLGTTSGPVANMVIGEVVASGTDDWYVTYHPVLLSTYLSHEWLIDTGANVHICADISLFVSYQQSWSDSDDGGMLVLHKCLE